MGHICQLSNYGAKIDLNLLPYEGFYKDALTWGDDYELCFTVPKNKELKLNKLLSKLKLKKFKIGEIVKGKGIKVVQDNKEIKLNRKSYNHFAS